MHIPILSKSASTLEYIHPRNIKFLAGSVHHLMQGRLWLQVLIAMVLGIAFGLMINPGTGYVSEKAAFAIGEWVALPGKLFLAFIQMIVVPLILASIIRGICSANDTAQLKSTGTWLTAYFILTTIIAVIIGISLGLIIKPGQYVQHNTAVIQESAVQNDETRAIVENAITASAASEEVVLADVPDKITAVLPTNPLGAMVEGDMLQIVIFAIILGIGLLSVPTQSAKPLLELFGSIQQVSMAIVAQVMRIAPLAVFGLLAQAMIKTGPEVLTGLGIYAASVVFGMMVLLVVYTLIAVIIGRLNPLTFLRGIREPFLLGFSTNSSAATMPVTVKAAEEKLKIRPSIAQFTIPLGATINMGGTALYQGLATIFMAQMFNMDLPLSTLVALVATALGASIGTPAVPGVGIIVLASVLSSVGIPLSGLALIIGLDRILERFRTSLNVTGDLTACLVMEHFVPQTKTPEEEIIEEEKHEKRRKKHHEDVIVSR